MKHYLLLLLLSIASLPGTISVKANSLREYDWGVTEPDYTFSNYGYINLTREVTKKDIGQFEKIIEGNVIHLSWVEHEHNKPSKVWYRRSNNLGESWEEPVLIGTMGARYTDSYLVHTHLMSVDDGLTYFMLPEDSLSGQLDSWDNEMMTKKLYFYRSDDKGKNFIRKELVSIGDLEWGNIIKASMKVVDGKVAVAYYTYDYYRDIDKRQDRLYYAFSKDKGETFHRQRVIFKEKGNIVDRNFDPMDFKFDGSRLVTLHQFRGKVWVAISDLGGQAQTQSISPSYMNAQNEVHYNACLNQPYFHHQDENNLVVDDDRIYVLMDAQLQDDTKEVPVVVRSDDGGKTWGQAVPVAQNVDPKHPTDIDRSVIAAKGDLVYIVAMSSNNKGYRWTTLYYSHDGGKTFSYKKKELQDISNREYYQFYLDPNDPSGQTAYVLYNNSTWIKTTDGFNTICESFSDVTENVSEYAAISIVHLLIDGQGHRHWFLLYAPYISPNQYLERSISYLKEGEPAPSQENYALRIGTTNSQKQWDRGMVTAIPSSTTLRCDSAATFELWVKIDTLTSITLAGQTTDTEYGSMSVSKNNAGWYFYFKSSYYSTNFEAGLGTDKDQTATFATPNGEMEKTVGDLKWHHLALTFDAHLQRACFYVDGVLIEEKEIAGRLKWGPNPVFFGVNNMFRSRALIDNFRIWNRALTAEELRANMKRNQFNGEEDLKVFLNFNKTLKDMSGNGNDARSLCGTYFVNSEITGIGNTVTAEKACLKMTSDGGVCELLLPYSATDVQLKVFGLDGRIITTRKLGQGNHFYFELPRENIQIIVITANGNRYVWKMKATQRR